MTSLSEIRSILESTVEQALPGTRIVFDNTYETPPPLPYAIATVSFDSISTDQLGGGTSPMPTGTMQVNCYTAKQLGSGAAEGMALAVLDAWEALAAATSTGQAVRVVPRSLEGPRTLSPDGRASHAVVVSGAFTAAL